MEENKTTYVLYLYNVDTLKKFPGASKGKQYYNSEEDAIKVHNGILKILKMYIGLNSLKNMFKKCKHLL